MHQRAQLSVSLSCLGDNFEQLGKLAPSNDLLFMVKANGYGHGMLSIVDYSFRECSITQFGCASLDEAIDLRRATPSLHYELYVFSDTQLAYQEKRELYLNYRLLPVVSSLSDLQALLGDKSCRHLPISLKFNTGMNRLGIEQSEVEGVLAALKSAGRKSIYHLMSHFALASDSKDAASPHPFCHQQYSSFQEIKRELTAAGIAIERTSMANSGAIEQNFALDESHIRPGLMLYGPSALSVGHRQNSRWRGKNISTFESSVLKLFPVSAGDVIGYGATPIEQDGIVAILPIGYGDGLSRRYQGVELQFDGVPGIFWGRVNMDLAQIFFAGKSDANQFKVGQEMKIWEQDSSRVLSIADQMETIPYEVFTQLTSRVARNYI
ncbi:MAG: alanine racemase [Bdellovibrionales bacterium]|jgi:alanine racemase|nr:alanine racemase [Bdellovibrionales bacterium]MBT3526467.1 alanine racemase [Bdellovibrionales bacterium]MBT7669364.1 alanine racemase [Bdellovibrionales bacterium]